MLHRVSKSAAKEQMSIDASQALTFSGEESDDSLVGEHSPFVKQPPPRKRYDVMDFSSTHLITVCSWLPRTHI